MDLEAFKVPTIKSLSERVMKLEKENGELRAKIVSLELALAPSSKNVPSVSDSWSGSLMRRSGDSDWRNDK